MFSSKPYKFKTCLKHKILFARYTNVWSFHVKRVSSFWKPCVFRHSFTSQVYRVKNYLFLMTFCAVRAIFCQSKFYKSTIYLKRIWKKLGRNIYVTKETANGKTHPSKNGQWLFLVAIWVWTSPLKLNLNN